MKHVIEAIARDIPKEIKNHQLIKRQDIYIPYREIGIECLTKDTAEINLFYETILKFIDIGVCDIEEIAKIIGVEYKLLKEVIVDMIEEHYISTSQYKLVMTKRGREALLSRKLVTIQKKNINQVMVNMITGVIEESEHITISRVKKYDLCLNEITNITKDFLESNYSSINDIYQKNRIESSIFQMRYTSRELYKILDVAYNELCFVKEELLIYKNEDSDDYEYIISNDSGDRYINAFYNQVKEIIFPGLENLFERDWKFVKDCEPFCLIENSEKKQTDKLKHLLHDCDAITDEVYQEFTKSRKLLDNKEIEKYFLYKKDIPYEGIIIAGNRLRKILSREIINSLNEESKKKIIIIYDSGEYDIENFLKHKFQILIKKGKIQLIREDHLSDNYICFYPNILIDIRESIANIFRHSVAILEGNIYFDSSEIKAKMASVIEKKKIAFIDEGNDNNVGTIRTKGKKDKWYK